MSPEPCFNRLWRDILLKNVSLRRSDNQVRKACGEYYRITPGYVFRGVPIQIEGPMLVGIDEKAEKILMPFKKPCYGTSLYVIDTDKVEIATLRKTLGKQERGTDTEKAFPGKKSRALPVQPGDERTGSSSHPSLRSHGSKKSSRN